MTIFSVRLRVCDEGLLLDGYRVQHITAGFECPSPGFLDWFSCKAHATRVLQVLSCRFLVHLSLQVGSALRVFRSHTLCDLQIYGFVCSSPSQGGSVHHGLFPAQQGLHLYTADLYTTSDKRNIM